MKRNGFAGIGMGFFAALVLGATATPALAGVTSDAAPAFAKADVVKVGPEYPTSDAAPKPERRRRRAGSVDAAPVQESLMATAPAATADADAATASSDADQAPSCGSGGPLLTLEMLRLYLSWLGVDLETAICLGLLDDPRLYGMFIEWLWEIGYFKFTATAGPVI